MPENKIQFRLILKDTQGRGVFVDVGDTTKSCGKAVEKLVGLYDNILVAESIGEKIEAKKREAGEEARNKQPDIKKIKQLDADIIKLEKERDKLEKHGKESNEKKE